jgi:hypothetical protein
MFILLPLTLHESDVEELQDNRPGIYIRSITPGGVAALV